MHIKSLAFPVMFVISGLVFGFDSPVGDKKWYALHAAQKESMKVTCVPSSLGGLQLDLWEPEGISDSLELKGNMLYIEERPVLHAISVLVAGGMPKYTGVTRDEDQEYYEPAKFLLVGNNHLRVLNHAARKNSCSMETASVVQCAKQKDLQQLQDVFAVISHIKTTCTVPTLVIDLEAHLEKTFGIEWRNKLPIKRVPRKPSTFLWNIWHNIRRSEPHVDLTQDQLQDCKAAERVSGTCEIL